MIRYGGEEFLAVLPAASRDDIRSVGERLRRLVAEASVKDGDQSISVTISIGGTSYPEIDVEGEQDLVKLADEALYSARQLAAIDLLSRSHCILPREAAKSFSFGQTSFLSSSKFNRPPKFRYLPPTLSWEILPGFTRSILGDILGCRRGRSVDPIGQYPYNIF